MDLIENIAQGIYQAHLDYIRRPGTSGQFDVYPEWTGLEPRERAYYQQLARATVQQFALRYGYLHREWLAVTEESEVRA